MKKAGIPYRFLYIFFFGLLLLAPLTAQVDREELDDHGPVEFINYVGPQSRIETREQIRAIGYGLGQVINAGAATAGPLGRYFIIHSVSEADGSKLDADIMGLGADVGVDHIRNLRLIIQGYLEAAYGYSESDAALLAEYITFYNAVYRGDMNYFGSRYKNPVIGNLTQEKAGLSVRYDEWPGQTLMLIPLGSGVGGPLSSIDTSSISDDRVIEQMRQEPDMSIDQRKDMVDLMEREADEATQQAAIIREAIQDEEQRIVEERQQAVQQEQQARQEQEQIAQERQQPGADQEALDRREEEAQQREQEAQEQQQDLDRREEALDEQREDADRQEEFAEQKIEEAQEERQRIAEDQQTLLEPQPQAQTDNLLGVALLSQNSSLGRLVRIDSASGEEKLRSPLTTVNVKTIALVNNRIFAIAGENRGDGAIRLVEITSDTLEMQKQGVDDIAPESLLWVNGQDLYAVTVTGGNYYLARFNTDLELQARSPMAVHPYASATFIQGFIATQRSDGSAVLLNPMDLSDRRQ